MTPRTGVVAFLGWIPAGTCITLGVAAAPSFGLFVLPLAAVALVLARRRLRAWPEALGAFVGGGCVLLVIALVNSDYRSCSSGPVTAPAGQSSLSCGGLDPAPFLVAGLALCAAAAVAYAALSRRH